MATKGKSAREVQEEIEAALRSRKRQRTPRRLRWIIVPAMVAAVVVALLAFAAWLGLLAFHLGAGATVGDALEMTVDDVRVAARCPQELGAVSEFLTRGASLPLSSLADLSGSQAYSLICDGRYAEIAPSLSPR